MNATWIIAKRELNANFDSLMAYIVLVLFLGFSGYFTWISGGDIFYRKQADLVVFFAVAKWTLFFFIPAITMRQFAEEYRTGTIELLLTRNVTERQVVLGKFFASLLIVVIALACTLPYYVTVSMLGNVDHGATLLGYLGLILLSASYISIGLFASSTTNNQIVAFLLSLFIGIFFHFLFDIMAGASTGLVADVLQMLSATYHFDSMARGVVDTKDLVFFASIILLGLLLTEYNLRNRR